MLHCYSVRRSACDLTAGCNDTDATDANFIDGLEKTYCAHCTERCEYNVYAHMCSGLAVSESFIESNQDKLKVAKSFVSVGRGLNSYCDLREPYENMSIYEWAAQHLVAIEISFRDNKVEVWETRPAMTPVDLLSSVGGTMGLYLGISVVTVFEVSSLLVKICTACCGRCRKLGQLRRESNHGRDT